jgi:hypothetical protein
MRMVAMRLLRASLECGSLSIALSECSFQQGSQSVFDFGGRAASLKGHNGRVIHAREGVACVRTEKLHLAILKDRNGALIPNLNAGL